MADQVEMKQQPEKITEEIFGLFELHGADEYAGEQISQLEHMYQSALLAEQENAEDEVILAAFLHDIGHLLPLDNTMRGEDGIRYGMVDHEKLGADWLRRKGFGDRLCRLIASHVDAKRYLTWRHPEYYEALSEASKQTLVHQGGRMEIEEARAFEADPLFELYIRMRRWDEAAKETGIPVDGLDRLRLKLLNYLNH